MRYILAALLAIIGAFGFVKGVEIVQDAPSFRGGEAWLVYTLGVIYVSGGIFFIELAGALNAGWLQ
jgi:hypothetical protein